MCGTARCCHTLQQKWQRGHKSTWIFLVPLVFIDELICEPAIRTKSFPQEPCVFLGATSCVSAQVTCSSCQESFSVSDFRLNDLWNLQ